MTAVLLVKCDGEWPQPGKGACSAYLPLPMGDLERARALAVAGGWSLAENKDLCPAHTRMATGV